MLALATVAVAERDEWRREAICDRLASLGGANAIAFFDMPRLEVSSTMVRERARERWPIRYLVPEPVRTYIEERGLYRATVNAS